MKTSSFLRLVAASLFAFAASAAPSRADDSALNSKDKSFVQDAYQDGLAEIDAAQMAERKTANNDIKSFAAMIIKDHSAANTELKALADSKKVSTATEASMIDRAKAKMLDAKVGGDFDKAYIDSMINDHKKDIEKFQKIANEGQDQDVKNLANKTLPTLKAHLSAAEGIQGKIGKP